MAKKNEEPQAEWDQIEIGDQVKHLKWGVGTVLFRSGTGTNAKAIVVFPEEGQKKLMLRFAKLKKVGTTTLKSVEKLKAETQPPKPVVHHAHKPPAEVEEGEEVALPLGDEEPELLIGEEEGEVAGFDDDEEEKDFGESTPAGGEEP
jgi:hypothetical protein